MEIEIFPEPVFQVPFVIVPYILRKVAKECERGRRGWQLGYKLDFYILPFDGWWRVFFYFG
jgi:hypothetical protein